MIADNEQFKLQLSFIHHLQNECGATHSFRDLIDNLTDEQICESIISWHDKINKDGVIEDEFTRTYCRINENAKGTKFEQDIGEVFEAENYIEVYGNNIYETEMRIYLNSVDPRRIKAIYLDLHSDLSEMIINNICGKFKVSRNSILGRDRHKEVSDARQLIMYLIRKSTNKSYPKIGDILNCNHSTVVHGCKAVQNRMDTEPKYKIMVEDIINKLGLQK